MHSCATGTTGKIETGTSCVEVFNPLHYKLSVGLKPGGSMYPNSIYSKPQKVGNRIKDK